MGIVFLIMYGMLGVVLSDLALLVFWLIDRFIHRIHLMVMFAVALLVPALVILVGFHSFSNASHSIAGFDRVSRYFVLLDSFVEHSVILTPFILVAGGAVAVALSDRLKKLPLVGAQKFYWGPFMALLLLLHAFVSLHALVRWLLPGWR